MRTLTAAAILTLLPLAARADGLAELKTALAGYGETDLVSATLTAEVSSEEGEPGSGKVRRGTAEVLVSSGPDGLTVRYAPALLERLRKEGNAPADERDKGATGLALARLDAAQVASLVGFAGSLSDALRHASLVREEPTSRAAGGRVVVLRIEPDLSADDRKRVKEYSDEMKVWLDASGAPVAAERSLAIRFKVLLASINVTRNEAWELRATGDRLIARSYRASESSSGLGEQNRTTVAIGLRLEG